MHVQKQAVLVGLICLLKIYCVIMLSLSMFFVIIIYPMDINQCSSLHKMIRDNVTSKRNKNSDLSHGQPIAFEDSTSGRLTNRGYCYRRKKVEKIDLNGECADLMDEANQLQEYIILVVGGTTVGKSSLIRQLLDCDPSNLATDRDSEIDDGDSVTKKLRVLVLGRECEICFTECDIDEGLDFPLNDHFDSAIVIYSVTNEASFQLATDVLNQIRNHCEREFPIFLLANKIDLQRQRIISTLDGRELAENFDCKFIEASIELGCETEDLLSEMLSELNPEKCDESASSLSGKEGNNRKKMSYPETSVQWGRRSPIIPNHDRKYSLSVETAKLCTRLARSCEDLFSKLQKVL
uniref:Uncharacterized protein n=1 Tax=Romanomermis culicivorax TaxID=13658 RepID=A0A915KXM2_ROMCU